MHSTNANPNINNADNADVPVIVSGPDVRNPIYVRWPGDLKTRAVSTGANFYCQRLAPMGSRIRGSDGREAAVAVVNDAAKGASDEFANTNL